MRQGRRIVGEYTVTEHDSIPQSGRERPHIHKDAIAVYEHGFDSHPCRTRSGNGAVITTADGYDLLDGVIYFKSKMKSPNRPSTIPYRAIIPEHIDGLIVPTALSASSVAYSSIRMEPVWMATGQAAGTAAALAISRKLSPRKVDVRELQRTLLKQRHVICYFKDLSVDDPALEALQVNAIEEDASHYEVASIRLAG